MFKTSWINNLILLWNETGSSLKRPFCSLGSRNNINKSLLTWCAQSKHVLSADYLIAFYTHGAGFDVMFGGAHLASFPLFPITYSHLWIFCGFGFICSVWFYQSSGCWCSRWAGASLDFRCDECFSKILQEKSMFAQLALIPVWVDLMPQDKGIICWHIQDLIEDHQRPTGSLAPAAVRWCDFVQVINSSFCGVIVQYHFWLQVPPCIQ